MRINRKSVAIAAAIAALGAGGVGVASAIGGDDESVTGPDAEKAKSAAVQAVGGGSVTEVEHQDGDGGGVYEVEVKRADGSQVEVDLDGAFHPVGTAGDDDSGSGSDDDGAGDDD
jgi:hypothetical protein